MTNELNNLSNVVNNINSFLTSEQNKAIDNIYKETFNSLLSSFSDSINTEDKPSDFELDNIDNELENAIKLLSSSISQKNDNEQTRKYNEIDDFLEKYKN